MYNTAMLILYIPTINFILALGAVALFLVTIALCIDAFFCRGVYFETYIRKYAFPVITAVTAGSVVMTLVYSEYFGFVPCSLCWLQRIALYPQVLMTLIAWRVEDRMYYPLYGMGIALFGFVVAAYHYVYQHLPKEVRESVAPCLLDGSNADCADKIMSVFGFITFPLLSAVTFLFLAVVYFSLFRAEKNKAYSTQQ